MSELVIKGTIKSIGDVQVISDKFKKVEFVIETTEDQYPKTIMFQVTNDKIDNFLKYNDKGQEVEVKFDIESKEFNGRYFTNATAWRIANVGQKPQQDAQPQQPTQSSVPPVAEGDKDDLPF